MTPHRQHTHFGAYVLLRRGANVLLVCKVRGPYLGKWDLPGGKIEFGEAPEATAQREVREETGLVVSGLRLQAMLAHIILWNTPDGCEEHLHHLGAIYASREAHGTLRIAGDNEDAAGAAWHRIATLDADDLTPFARRALFGNTA